MKYTHHKLLRGHLFQPRITIVIVRNIKNLYKTESYLQHLANISMNRLMILCSGLNGKSSPLHVNLKSVLIRPSPLLSLIPLFLLARRYCRIVYSVELGPYGNMFHSLASTPSVLLLFTRCPSPDRR